MRTLDDFVALSKQAREGKTLPDLLPRMPAPDRDRLKKIYASDPDAFLFLAGVTSLRREEAAALADAKARFLVANDLETLDGATAARLAAFAGEQLYLDGLHALDKTTAAGLAGFKGKLLSLGGLKNADPAALAELVRFKGAVAISMGSDSRAPAKRSPEETALLVGLVKAIDRGDVDFVKKYLAGGGKPDFGENGNTLVMEAAYKKQPAIVKALVEAGGDVNARSDVGDSPLSFAVTWPMFDDRPKNPKAMQAIAELLVDHGAKVDDHVLEAAFEEAERDLRHQPAKDLAAGWAVTLSYLAAKNGTQPAVYAHAHDQPAVEAMLRAHQH